MGESRCHLQPCLSGAADKGPNTFRRRMIPPLPLRGQGWPDTGAESLRIFGSKEDSIRDCTISAFKTLNYSSSKEVRPRSSFRIAQRTSLNSQFPPHSGNGRAWTSAVPFPNGLHGNHAGSPIPAEETDMKTWRKPKTAEIRVGTEINAYACAGL